MEHKRAERRLTAILAADVADYGRLMGFDEEGTRAAVKAVFSSVLRPQIERHRGHVAKDMGDGLLAEFASAVDATRCAIDIQRRVAEQSAGLPDQPRIELRIGVNVGDIIFDGGDIFGDGVNIAARIQALANPGTVFLSEFTYQQVRGKIAAEASDMGEQHLKNIAEPVRVYCLHPAGVTARAAPLTLPDKPSIAVLPFSNLSIDPEQEYFADGIVEDIITALSRHKWLFVIARTSSFTYKGKSLDVRQIARELGVRYVLEGSVRKAGDKVRITGQVIDGANGAHVWADNFDGALEDIFDLQDRIAASVATAIEPTLRLAEIGRLKQKPLANFDAYDLLLRAWQHWYEFTEESLTAALRCLEKARAIDPTYAPAMGMIANCFAWRRLQGWTQDFTAETTEGLRLASRAVELAPDDSQVLAMASFAVMQLAMDAQRAKDLIYRSLVLNPNSAIALTTAGALEMSTANPNKALELMHLGERLSPRDPRGWIRTVTMAHARFQQGQFDEAVSMAQEALTQNYRYAPALRILAASLAKLGQTEKAAEAMGEMLKLQPQLTLSRLRARSMFYDESVWNKLADGLRLAGMPE